MPSVRLSGSLINRKTQKVTLQADSHENFIKVDQRREKIFLLNIWNDLECILDILQYSIL